MVITAYEQMCVEYVSVTSSNTDIDLDLDLDIDNSSSLINGSSDFKKIVNQRGLR